MRTARNSDDAKSQTQTVLGQSSKVVAKRLDDASKTDKVRAGLVSTVPLLARPGADTDWVAREKECCEPDWVVAISSCQICHPRVSLRQNYCSNIGCVTHLYGIPWSDGCRMFESHRLGSGLGF